MTSNIWADRFIPLHSDEEIKHLVSIRPPEVVDLDKFSMDVSASMLGTRLHSIYLPNSFALRLLREINELAYSHCSISYENQQLYKKHLYSPTTREYFPICLTGYAGIGKSELLNAIPRIFPQDTDLLIEGLGKVPLKTLWHVNMKDKKGIKQVLQDFTPDLIGKSITRIGVDELLRICRKIAFRDGISFMSIDELQFYSQSITATKICKSLLETATIGLPVIYAANFDLCTKILTRPQQERQRLLVEPRVMWPDDPDGDDWFNFVSECIRVSGGILPDTKFDFPSILFRYTAGIKRLVVHLIKLAYRKARARGAHEISALDIDTAYSSAQYFSNKKDIQCIQSQIISNKPERMDLWCPFESQTMNSSNIRAFTAAIRDTQVSTGYLRSTMTPAQLESFESLQEKSFIDNTSIVKPVSKRNNDIESLKSAFNKISKKTDR
ncbi:hypothetical protein [Pseudomonas putida]|uniref:hypothetical protein n=1 Tax=Pseudomonas putida TaxID=303 RepID=UPI000A9518CF|nr:hypothetical protein [Pseudomonas putida]